MSALTISELGITEIAIIFAAIAYVTQIILDGMGLSRSSRTLRTENEDLIRRNNELDDVVGRLKGEVARMESELAGLRAQVTDLSKRDQAAVLKAIELHEQAAGVRHERMVTVLTEIRDAVKAA